MDRWTGRVALVTGCSAGIGESICKELVKHGMIVVGCDRITQRALSKKENIFVGPGKFHFIKCDLQEESEILAMFGEIRRTFFRVDVCINNAGITSHRTLATGKTDEWRRLLEVNVLALCICTRESLILMKEKDIEDGQIIQIGGAVGHNIPVCTNTISNISSGIYCGTKFMVRALAEALRQEIKMTGSRTRVATISPGIVKTGMYTKHLGHSLSNIIYSSTVFLESKDVADAVTFILSTPHHINVEDIVLTSIQIPKSGVESAEC